VAEIELNLLLGQCLNRRIDKIKKDMSEVLYTRSIEITKMQKSVGNLELMIPGLSYHISIRQLRLDMTISPAFTEVGISFEEILKNDQKIKKVAQIAYKKILRFPYRAIIKAIIGEKGFTKVVYTSRDKMIAAKSTDLTWRNLDNLKNVLSQFKKQRCFL
jgi:hypothetical protein